MAYPLIVESTTDVDIRCMVVVEDYTRHPAFCRSGIWVGERCEFKQQVVLSYEHDPEQLYVGWAINGNTVFDPGLSAGSRPEGDPVPGAAGLAMLWPYEGYGHKIALIGTPGMERACPWVQVLYRSYTAQETDPALAGPGTYICVNGFRIDWPLEKLDEERNCRLKFVERLRRLAQIARVSPGDPVERWLQGADRDTLIRLAAIVDALDEVDSKKNAALKSALESEIALIVGRLRQTDLLIKGAPDTT